MFHQNNPRPRSNISAAWAHFTRKRNGLSAKCNYCGADVACPCGSTSGMFSHLRAVHPAVYEKEQSLKSERYRFINSLVPVPGPESDPDSGGIFIPGQMILPDASNKNPALQQEYEGDEEEEEVHIKANDVYHLPKTIFPELADVYKCLPSKKIYNDITGYDVILHCQNGLLSAHKLILGSASRFLKSLFTWRDVDHIFLADFNVETVSSILESLYTGQMNVDPTVEDLVLVLGISLIVEPSADDSIEADPEPDPLDHVQPLEADVEDQQGLDIKKEGEDDTEMLECQVNIEADHQLQEQSEPVDSPLQQLPLPHFLKIADVRTEVPAGAANYFDIDGQSGSFEDVPANQSAMHRSGELDRKVSEMKARILKECSKISSRNDGVPTNKRRPTRLPSKIWKWFDKTPTTLTCLVCQAQLRNCGNTTNAAFHLKKHPFQYERFRNESNMQQCQYNRRIASKMQGIVAPNRVNNIAKQFHKQYIMETKYVRILPKPTDKVPISKNTPSTSSAASNILNKSSGHVASDNVAAITAANADANVADNVKQEPKDSGST